MPDDSRFDPLAAAARLREVLKRIAPHLAVQSRNRSVAPENREEMLDIEPDMLRVLIETKWLEAVMIKQNFVAELREGTNTKVRVHEYWPQGSHVQTGSYYVVSVEADGDTAERFRVTKQHLMMPD